LLRANQKQSPAKLKVAAALANVSSQDDAGFGGSNTCLTAGAILVGFGLLDEVFLKNLTGVSILERLRHQRTRSPECPPIHCFSLSSSNI
jgi:hypothetical protein